MTQPVSNDDPRICRQERFTDALFQLVPNGRHQALEEILVLFNARFNDPPLDDHIIGKVSLESAQRVNTLRHGPLVEPIYRFVQEECVKPYSYQTTTVRTKTADLHQAFLRFADANNYDLPNVTVQEFGRILTKLGIPVKRKAGANCRPITVRQRPASAMWRPESPTPTPAPRYGP